MDLFEQKRIAPMLLHRSQPFDSDDYLFELKFDGVRCIAYLDPKLRQVTLENKRFKDVSAIYPELSEMHFCVKKRTILDGELVSMVDGKPNFFALQRRTLLGDKFRIERAAKVNPVQFVCFDILYSDGKNLTGLPLTKRKQLLQKCVSEGHGLAISRFTEGKGKAFFALAKAENLEGVVAKKKDGLYHIGKRTRDWLKIKVMQDEDLFVCGYQPDTDGSIKDVILCEKSTNATHKSEEFVCRGKVYLGISATERRIIADFAKRHPVSEPIFPQYKNVVWFEPRLIGTVEYMHKTEGGSMRQPVWKGLRVDV